MDVPTLRMFLSPILAAASIWNTGETGDIHIMAGKLNICEPYSLFKTGLIQDADPQCSFRARVAQLVACTGLMSQRSVFKPHLWQMSKKKN